MRENSMSVREDLKVTVFAMRASFTLSWKFAVELHGALYVGDRDFIDPAFDVDVAGDLLDFDRAFFLADFDVAVYIFDVGVGMLSGDVDVAVAAGPDSHPRGGK